MWGSGFSMAVRLARRERLFPALPIDVVIADQRLVIEPIDLHGQRPQVGRQGEHAGNRLRREKLQPGGTSVGISKFVRRARANPQTPNDGTAA